MTQVSLAGVSKTYPPDVQAVRAARLEVKGGELLVLIGPSGCGKSTILRLVAGLEQVSAGDIRFGPKLVTHLPPADRNVAMVFQEDALQPHLTVRQNLALGWRLRHGWLARLWRRKEQSNSDSNQGDIDQRITEAARMLDIESLLDRHPWQLSGGEKQRVALGRAIVRTPDVLLMDEPLSNLDVQLREQMRAEIAAIHRRLGTTTIYVTHDQVEAMTLGERIAVMDAGSIQQTGTPLEVYDRPVNRRVAGLLGSPPMNFVEGEIVAAEGDRRFVGGGLQVDLVHERAARLGDCVGRRVVLGIRPEHVHVLSGEGSRTRKSSDARSLATSATSRGTSLAKIVMVETLGDSTILRLGLESSRTRESSDARSLTTSATGALLTCKLAGRFAGEVNQRVRIDIEAKECHVFDAEGGTNLTI